MTTKNKIKKIELSKSELILLVVSLWDSKDKTKARNETDRYNSINDLQDKLRDYIN